MMGPIGNPNWECSKRFHFRFNPQPLSTWHLLRQLQLRADHSVQGEAFHLLHRHCWVHSLGRGWWEWTGPREQAILDMWDCSNHKDWISVMAHSPCLRPLEHNGALRSAVDTKEESMKIEECLAGNRNHLGQFYTISWIVVVLLSKSPTQFLQPFPRSMSIAVGSSLMAAFRRQGQRWQIRPPKGPNVGRTPSPSDLSRWMKRSLLQRWQVDSTCQILWWKLSAYEAAMLVLQFSAWILLQQFLKLYTNAMDRVNVD